VCVTDYKNPKAANNFCNSAFPSGSPTITLNPTKSDEDQDITVQIQPLAKDSSEPTSGATNGTPKASCIAGRTRVVRAKHPDSVELSSNVIKVKNLKIGDLIRGYDSGLNPAQCRVEAIGSFGSGVVFGNYTSSHYLFNPHSKVIEENGKEGDIAIDEKFDLISDCPLVEDEVGNRFSSIDSDFCGGSVKNMSWRDYLLLHKAILNVVYASGPFWFDGDSYKNFEMVNMHAPHVCRTILYCVKDHNRCNELEDASIAFIDNGLTDSARKKAYEKFHNIGSHRRLGSVSASVTSGKSVRRLREQLGE